MTIHARRASFIELKASLQIATYSWNLRKNKLKTSILFDHEALDLEVGKQNDVFIKYQQSARVKLSHMVAVN